MGWSQPHFSPNCHSSWHVFGNCSPLCPFKLRVAASLTLVHLTSLPLLNSLSSPFWAIFGPYTNYDPDKALRKGVGSYMNCFFWPCDQDITAWRTIYVTEIWFYLHPQVKRSSLWQTHCSLSFARGVQNKHPNYWRTLIIAWKGNDLQ